MDYEVNGALLAPSPEDLAQVKVFPLIPHIKKDVVENIDSALTWEQLTASDINFAVVRPLIFKYAKLKNMAVVYACLVVRSHFLSLAGEDMAYAALMASRASMCELLAMKLLRYFASNEIELVAVLTTSWSPIAGAPSEVIEDVKHALGGRDDDLDDPTSALEMAIATKAKSFLSSPLVQTVVNSIFAGRVAFSTASNRSLLADNYKPRAIEIYDSRKAPFLNHYRLRVPKYSAILEFVNFAILLLTFVLCLSDKHLDQFGVWEGVFIIFALGFALSEYVASREYGWGIYIASMWNVFDASFIVIFLIYLGLRVKGLLQHDAATADLAFDVLACGACILLPRLAFFAIKNNVVILALRGMIAEFVFFMAIASICFSGLLFTLWTLASEKWQLKSITWLMVQIWFGNTYLSFAQAESFHPIFGPILMTAFAALSNTLLLTILISILSNTFSRIDQNASQEYLYQFTITTIEGVKSDALFSYQPPFNLLAYGILRPLSWILTPRRLHSTNVFLIKVTSFPILVLIGLYERYLSPGARIRKASEDTANSIYNSLPRNLRNMPIIEALAGSTANDLYDAIFDVEMSPQQELFDDADFGGFDDEAPALRSLASNSHTPSVTPQRRRVLSAKGVSPSRGMPPSPTPSARRRRKQSLPPMNVNIGSVADSLEVPPAQKSPSPLARLFSAPRLLSAQSESVGTVRSDDVLNSIKRMEGILEGMKDLPVQRLKDDMKELQERQARIESLLLTLTRGMRNDVPSRQGTGKTA